MIIINSYLMFNKSVVCECEIRRFFHFLDINNIYIELIVELEKWISLEKIKLAWLRKIDY